MKKFLYIFLLITLCTGVSIAATYTIKQSGNSTVIKNSAQNKNLYNNYSANQYVQNKTVNSNPTSVVELVMDYSGSMSDVVQVAQNTMANVVAQIPSSTKIGLRVFGQSENSSSPKMATVQSVQKSTDSTGKTVYKLKTGNHQDSGGSCNATKLVTPITQANTNALLNGMYSVNIGGSTPMVKALEKAAYNDMSTISRNIPKKIILITDGGENCGGDPCAFAKTLMSTRRDIQVDVVLVSANSKSLYCLASTTGGKVYNLGNVYQFQDVITKSINAPAKNSTQNTNVQQYDQNENQQNYEFLDE